MSELTLLVLRLGFLVLIWVFVFSIVYALRTDLFGARVRRLGAEAAEGNTTPQAAPVAAAHDTPAPRESNPGRPAARLVITSGTKKGLSLTLGSDPLTIGRSAESGLVIRDEYTSTHHARLMLWDEGWMVQDLDSTNGTYLDGKRVTGPVRVPKNTPVRIGTTSFELRD